MEHCQSVSAKKGADCFLQESIFPVRKKVSGNLRATVFPSLNTVDWDDFPLFPERFTPRGDKQKTYKERGITMLKKSGTYLLLAVCCLSLSSIVPITANAYLVELPGANPFIYNAIPFDYSLFGSGRYQQVYDSSLFIEKGFITSVLFWPSYTGTYGANITISLAYTSVPAGSLSTDLDSNITGPTKEVLSNPNLSQWVDPCFYCLVFDFSSPTIFFYDPDKGNLLVDIVISGQGNLVARKFNPPFPYLSSRAWNSSNIGIGNDTDEGAPPAALCTRFQFTPVPDVLTFFDDKVADGTLEGIGPGSSAIGRMNAFRNMLVNSYDLLADQDITGACHQLLDAMNRCDGIKPPTDFVEGEARHDLWILIDDLRVSIGCTNP